jgi:hypothetical protein
VLAAADAISRDLGHDAEASDGKDQPGAQRSTR